MNLGLLESFGYVQNHPQELNGVLDSGTMALTVCFNRRGTLLAVGYNDGRVIIWDMITRGMVKVIDTHAHPVSSVCWSRDGRKLLTGSTDFTVCIGDVLSGNLDKRFNFPAPVFKAQFNPRNSGQFLVCPLKQNAFVVDVVDGTTRAVPMEDIANDANIFATFDRRGKYIYTGNSQAIVEVYQCWNMELVASFRVEGSSALSSLSIKNMEFARRGNWFLINCSDKVIRLYNSDTVLSCGKDGEPEPFQKLQDLVNRTNWRKCCFSGDGEYICAGSARSHSLYIWEKNMGNLVTILLGAKNEPLLDAVWHPVRPMIASISNGVVSLWTQAQVENWSAFAPDFKELDENVDCDERESEFDEEDEDKMIEYQNRMAMAEEEDLIVDVDTIAPIPAFLSSDECSENPDELLFIPTAPDIENSETRALQNQGQGLGHKRVCTDEENNLTRTRRKTRKSRRRTY